MIRYKVILTQTSIVDAEDEQEAKDKVVDTFDFGNLDVYAEELHPDDVNPDDDEHMKPMTREEEYRNADVPMPEDDYQYIYTEQSVDVRTYRVTSPKQLTSQEVSDMCIDSGLDREGEMTKDKETKIVIEYDGVDYGDDCQTEVEGDTKDE